MFNCPSCAVGVGVANDTVIELGPPTIYEGPKVSIKSIWDALKAKAWPGPLKINLLKRRVKGKAARIKFIYIFSEGVRRVAAGS